MAPTHTTLTGFFLSCFLFALLECAPPGALEGSGGEHTTRHFMIGFSTLLTSLFSRYVYAPVAAAEAVEAELVGDLGGAHGVGEILLVGEDQNDGFPQLVLVEHLVQLLVRGWGEGERGRGGGDRGRGARAGGGGGGGGGGGRGGEGWWGGEL